MLLLLLLASVALIIFLTAKWKVHPFLALLCASLCYALGSGMPLGAILTSIETGFGGTLGKIGLVILLGVIIGAFLEHTGAAYKMANAVLRLIGPKKVHAAMALIGYVVSIPVFADSGFIILDPLNKSLTKRAKLSLAGTAVALMLGLMITHVMVPPTPGPIAAAGILEANIGLVMGLGLGIGSVGLLVGIAFAKHVAGSTYIDPRPNVDDEEIAQKMAQAPSTFVSFLPIVVPIVLIVLKSVVNFVWRDIPEKNTLHVLIDFLGAPVIALIIGTLFAFLLPKKFDRAMLSESGWAGKALLSASSILLITGAGGIFGAILQNSAIGDVLANSLQGSTLGIALPFLIAAALKTAQGSSTVALITAASIMAPMVGPMGLESDMDRALMVVAIGAGGLVISHANDSAFWVLTQMTGMDVKTGYRLYTTGALLVGVCCALLVFLLSWLL
ncbi:GntP family permease [Maribacter sp. 2307ULW6-5]|uniref:GntP family permease n=1 Tax=Maribacter sp. 2307ULW6-5 TaxID=3386275 RepID=UPI0039BC5AB6